MGWAQIFDLCMVLVGFTLYAWARGVEDAGGKVTTVRPGWCLGFGLMFLVLFMAGVGVSL